MSHVSRTYIRLVNSVKSVQTVPHRLLLLIITSGTFLHLLIIQLQGGDVLSSLAELALLHPLTHVPVNEGPLGVHEVKFVVQSRPC